MSKPITSSVFKAFKPYDELLFECTTVLTDVCSSIWLHSVPACSAAPEKTVLRFRARKSSQDFPLTLLAAFKHHMENISKLGESILALRKVMTWIEEQECELSRISDIFHWNGGVVALANDIRKQHEIVLTTIKTMNKLGAITYRLSADHYRSPKPPSFKVIAIAEVNQPEMGCTIESGQMYTVIDQKNPYIWKLAESGQFVPSIFLEPSFSGLEERLCERVQNQLDSFKAQRLADTCKVLIVNLNKAQNQARSGPTFHFPLIPIPPKQGNLQSPQLPQGLRDALITYLEQIGKEEVSWEPVDRFWQWYLTNTATRTELIEMIQLGLRFIEALVHMESDAVTEFYEESGFNETEALPNSQSSSGVLNSSFSWQVKMETVTNTRHHYSWEGNLHTVKAPMCSQDPRTLEIPEAAATARAFTSKLIN